MHTNTEMNKTMKTRSFHLLLLFVLSFLSIQLLNGNTVSAATEYSQLFFDQNVGESGYIGLVYQPASPTVKDYDTVAFTIGANVIDVVEVPIPDAGCSSLNGLGIVAKTGNLNRSLSSGTQVGSICRYSISGGAGNLPTGYEFNSISFAGADDYILKGSTANDGATWDTQHGDVKYINGGFAFQFCNTSCSQSFTPTPPDNTATRIWISVPANNSTTTTPTTFTINYYLNSSTNGDDIPTGINLKIYNALLSGTDFHNIPIDTPVYDTVVSTTTVITLVNNQTYLQSADLYAEEVPDICNNPAIAVVYCGWLQATQRIIVSSGSSKFTIGTNPFNSIEDFGNSVFSATGVDQGIFEGQCAFVATSTCDGASPSTYPGCLMNVGLRLFCPSTGAINYATSTLSNILNNKIPFGFFTQSIGKLSAISSTSAPTSADDVVVNIDSLGNASTTIFSWSGAKAFMDNVVDDQTETIIIYVEWIIFGILVMLLVLRIHD